ncbi:hypothetical protein ACFQU2_39820 [Siccirubricoccus deserti]
MEIVRRSEIAPKTPTGDTSQMEAERVALLAEIDRLEQARAAVRKHMPQEWAIEEMARAGREQDTAKKRAVELSQQIEVAATAASRATEAWAFIREVMGPAIQGTWTRATGSAPCWPG